MGVLKLIPTKDVSIANHSYGGYYLYQAGRDSGLYLGSWDWPNDTRRGYYAYQGRALLQFDLSQIPSDAIITGAKLKMYLMKYDSCTEANRPYYSYDAMPQLNIHKMTQAWDEGIGNGKTDGYQYTGATWTNSTASGRYWNGGSYESRIIDWKKESTSQNHWWEFNVMTLVNEWRASPSTNYGLMVKYDREAFSGELWSMSREENTGYCPYLEITYNTPPEKPRGLVPAYGSFVCYDLSHTTHFKWTFIDTIAPQAKGRADIVFIIDVSGSMVSRLPSVRNEISAYIDRLEAAGVDWRMALVGYSDINIGEPINRYGWYGNKSDMLRAFDSMPRYYGGDWPESGLEAIMAAMDFSFRDKSSIHFAISCDAPFHNKSGVDTYYPNYSKYEVIDVANLMKSKGIVCSINTNTHCASYTQLHQLTQTTGGQYLDEQGAMGTYLKIITTMSADESQASLEGDTQSKADLYIWKILPNGSRQLIWSYTSIGPLTEVRTKGLGVPWEEGASYEWAVVTYDSSGLPSPMSDKAQFTYTINVDYTIGVPMFNEEIMAGNTINKRALMEFRDKLFDEVGKYRNLDQGEVEKLFTDEVVPSRDDMTRLRKIMNSMLTAEGLPLIGTDLIEDGVMGVTAVQNLRNKLVDISLSPPDTPKNGVARRVKGMMKKPISASSANDNALDTTIDVKWSPAEYGGAGWNVKFEPSLDTDINYYKVFHEQTIKYLNGTQAILTELYMNAEDLTGGSTYIPDTGRVDGQRIWYTSHDGNGRTSGQVATVNFDATVTGTDKVTVSYYIVEYQQKFWFANQPDPTGIWQQVYLGTATNFTHTVKSDGSYWYRVKAVDSSGKHTDWTYSLDRTYVKS